ncbi:LysR family transcriptional regulator [Vibrio harveyi]|uniref:LysR family transcriptional regulator n=1 Tax=Vibrio harveyi TaxID=669 RepID=UPI001EFCF4F8|nr:LysR family transcriptional regulator [Vibrio harveyi]MCG9235733.1 LysR family transcriptional regulator [Vibrio harveyi]MCG9586002.1 LysR family transcriptional regulator [Vibrio harveyi]CAH1206770.1 LysR family transcriptional regulator [Vibrio harveyi]CAH1550062.1 LysR family transcriptional regulator [Vibrio harveyi]CAH1554347.1 LysR family transcriptional regulator [Vibrio harveyi]
MKANKRTIDVKYLRTFSRVARHRSFTAAAESLYLTQPAVSQHIKKLERTIGAEVFDRKDGFNLTKHGKILLDYTDQTMSLYDQLFDELAQVDMFDRYSIAISDSFAPEIVAKVISSFRVYNDVELAVTSYSDLNCVDKENHDLVFAIGDSTSVEGRVFPLNREQYILACDCAVDPEECYPERIVFCNSLSRRDAEVLLDSFGVDISKVKHWLTTSSSRLMINELQATNTFVVCPSWTLGDHKCSQYLLPKYIEMYVWCNDSAAKKIDQERLRSLITETFRLTSKGVVSRKPPTSLLTSCEVM